MSENETHADRSGASWEEFLKRYRLKNIDETGGNYRVLSQTGQTYVVANKTCLDECGSMFFRWNCTCPARKQCRHIDAVINMRWAEAIAAEDYDGMDVMEKEELWQGQRDALQIP